MPEAPGRIDRRAARIRFERAAHTYAGASRLEAEVGARMLERLDYVKVPEGHLCCGWAGTYSVLQPGISQRLRERKVANIESVRPDIVAAGNFGCLGQIGAATQLPLCHTVELLDWATGGPQPAALTT